MTPEELKQQIKATLGGKSPDRSAAPGSDANVEAALSAASDPAKPATERRGALRILQAMNIAGGEFERHRAQFLDVLRGIVNDTEAPPELYRDALGLLSMEADPLAEEVLTATLDDSEGAARVSKAEALRLLATDDHSNVQATARQLLEDSSDEETRVEAMRALAQDATSQGLIRSVLENRSESRQMRSAAGKALRAVDPGGFQDVALGIARNDQEDSDLRATLASGLATMETDIGDSLRGDLEKVASDLDRKGSTEAGGHAARLRSQVARPKAEAQPQFLPRDDAATASMGDDAPLISVTRKF